MSRSKSPRVKEMKRPQKGVSETLYFDDEDAVRRVFGPAQENATVLEAELNIRLEAPGGGVIILTSADRATRIEAIRVLKDLYERASQNLPIDPALAKAACLMGREGQYDGGDDVIRVPRGAVFQGRTAGQKTYIRALNNEADYDLIFGVGPAGTGKTLLAVAYGAAQLVLGNVERLVITRPAVEAGERLGFLPGDLTEKIDPYLLPIWDSLRDAMGQRAMDKLREEGKIEVAPLAFMRGRTLNRAFVICDEAQNATGPQMRMVLTRLGEGSRMVITGDPTQTDLPAREPSGLGQALKILDGVPRISVNPFTRKDVVRHDLVAMIVDAYERADQAKGH